MSELVRTDHPEDFRGKDVKVTIELPDGTCYVTKGMFESAEWNVDYYAQQDTGGSYPTYTTGRRHFHLHLVNDSTIISKP